MFRHWNLVIGDYLIIGAWNLIITLLFNGFWGALR